MVEVISSIYHIKGGRSKYLNFILTIPKYSGVLEYCNSATQKLFFSKF